MPVNHARKLQRISARIARHTKALSRAQADLCVALTEAAAAARSANLITSAEEQEVIAPKDDAVSGGDD